MSESRRPRLPKIGLDLDGVFADFNTTAGRRLVEVTGRHLLPPFPAGDAPWYPEVWDWFKAYGYRPTEITAFWDHVAASPDFWLRLWGYPQAQKTLHYLQGVTDGGRAELYWITSRPGKTAHWQSVQWLQDHGIATPQVVVVDSPAQKGQIARGLKLNLYVDDHPPNLDAVAIAAPSCTTWLYVCPWSGETGESVDWEVSTHPELRSGLEAWLAAREAQSAAAQDSTS